MRRKSTRLCSRRTNSNRKKNVVEKILKKRVRSGRNEYLVKWNDINCNNTWELAENISPKRKIKEFESISTKRTLRNRSRFKEELKNDSEDMAEDDDETEEEEEAEVVECGFDLGLEPERIIGAKSINGRLMFLMKWKNVNMANMVLAKTANAKCPQIVISFYEKNLKWDKNELI